MPLVLKEVTDLTILKPKKLRLKPVTTLEDAEPDKFKKLRQNIKKEPSAIKKIAKFVGIPTAEELPEAKTVPAKVNNFIDQAVATLFAIPALGIKGIASSAALAKMAVTDPVALSRPGEFQKSLKNIERVIGKTINTLGIVGASTKDVIENNDNFIDALSKNWVAGRTLGTAVREAAEEQGLSRDTIRGVLANIAAHGLDLGTTILTIGGAIKGKKAFISKLRQERILKPKILTKGRVITPEEMKSKVKPELETPAFERRKKPITTEETKVRPIAKEPIKIKEEPVKPVLKEKLAEEVAEPAPTPKVELTDRAVINRVKKLRQKKAKTTEETAELKALEQEAKNRKLFEEEQPKEPVKPVEEVIEVQKPEKAVKTKAIDILPNKTQIIKDVVKAIAKAPEKSKAVEGDIVEFKIDGGVKIKNNKDALGGFLKAIRKLPKEMATTEAKAKLKKASAHLKEEIMRNRIVLLKENGWWSDGYIAIKGKLPPNAKISKTGKISSIKEVVGEVKDSPAELKYYTLNVKDVAKGVSFKPIAEFKKNVPSAIFESEGKFYEVNQNKLNVIRKRYPDAIYKIGKNDVIVAFSKGELVAAIMPIRQSSGIVAMKKPPLQKEAIEAGLLPKEVILPPGKEAGIIGKRRAEQHFPEEYDPLKDLELPTFIRNKMKLKRVAEATHEKKTFGEEVIKTEEIQEHLKDTKDQIQINSKPVSVLSKMKRIVGKLTPEGVKNTFEGINEFRKNAVMQSVEFRLNQMGKTGKEIAKRMEEGYFEGQRIAGGPRARLLEAFKGLKEAEIMKVTDIIENNLLLENLRPELQNAVKVTKSVLAEVDRLAKLNKLETQNIDGTIRSYEGKGDTYFPHMFPSEFFEDPSIKKSMIKKIKSDFAKKGVVKTDVEIEAMLDKAFELSRQRKAPNLEFAREIDLQGYEKDPRIAVSAYLLKAYTRFAELKWYGKRDAIMNELFNKLSVEGYDAKWAREQFRKHVGNWTADEYKTIRRTKWAKTMNVITKMGMSMYSNPAQMGNVLVRVGTKRFLQSFLDIYKKEGKDFADASGAVIQQTMREFTDINNPGQIYLKKTGFSGIEVFLRRWSANAGKRYALDLFELLQKDPTNAQALREMEKFRIDPEAALRRGRLTVDEVRKAGQIMSSKQTQFTGNVLELPSTWSLPRGRFATQFKSWAFAQNRAMKNYILNEATKHNNFMPLLRAASFGWVLGEVLQDLREFSKTGKIRDKGFWGRTAENYSLNLLGGLVFDFINAIEYGKVGVLGNAVGPSIVEGVDDALAVAELRKGKTKPLAKRLVTLAPLAVLPLVKNLPGWIAGPILVATHLSRYWLFPKKKKK